MDKKREVRLSLEKPFLARDEDDDREGSETESLATTLDQYQKQRGWLSRNRNSVLFHTLMIAIYFGVAMFLWQASQHSTAAGQRLLYSPANPYAVPQIKIIGDGPQNMRESEFVGTPTPELEAAWYDLLQYHFIRLEKDELEKLNKTSVPLSIGGGYQGMVAVFHELHCLKLIRQSIRADHYYPDLTEAQKEKWRGHSEHCIDALRQIAMCRADTTIYPFHWNEHSRQPNPTWVQPHQCVNWEHLRAWLDTRKVDIYTPGMLIHPKYGPSFPGGKVISEPDGPQVLPLDPL